MLCVLWCSCFLLLSKTSAFSFTSRGYYSSGNVLKFCDDGQCENIARFDVQHYYTGYRRRKGRILLTLSKSNSDNGKNDDESKSNTTSAFSSTNGENNEDQSRRTNLRKRVAQLAKNMVVKPISTAYHMPYTIAEVLKDATTNAVDLAVDEVFKKRVAGSGGANNNAQSLLPSSSSSSSRDIDISNIVDETFAPMEQALEDMERSLADARKSLKFAKSHAYDSMAVIQAAAIAQAEAAMKAMARAEALAERNALVDFYASTTMDDESVDTSALTLEDVDFTTSEMAPPFLNEDQCLVQGEPVVRVEKAPQNSRRIFAGIDIMESVDVVWNLLTDYDNLAKLVPNLLVNEVLERYEGSPQAEVKLTKNGKSLSVTEQCKEMCEQLKGAKLRQVGGAKVVGINFSAHTTLEVREWPNGLPAAFASNVQYSADETHQQRRERAANDMMGVKLERYRFPRPFAISKLPTRDITMQSVLGEDGEFRMYQGVWRMQPLPGCAPPGKKAMRLTYAVEVSPRAYLPVQFIEGRIVEDLCTNLNAIRDFAEKGAKVKV
ncbi:hypothetical protein ACA910_017107 [Epithemia clementina (nom. ined.)]